MKTISRYLLVSATVVLSLFLVNCGSSSNNSAPAAVAIGAQCGTAGQNMVQAPWGCSPSCGYSAAYQNGQCQQFQSTTGAYGINQYGSNYCQGSCPAGTIQISPNVWYPQGACMQQGTCQQACYGSDGQYCYPGIYAH